MSPAPVGLLGEVRGPAALIAEPLERRTRWNAAELIAHVFPEQRWAVPGLIAEGLNLLVGPPKLGKSWFALNLAVAIADGGCAFGRIEVDQGDVLYLALEDPARRLRDRLLMMLAGSPAPTRLDLETSCGSLAEADDLIREWLGEHPQGRCVVVDVWARVRGMSDAKANAYEADYLAAAHLKAIADDYSVTVIVVHHTRKSSADDWVDTVSGTNGLAGCADAILVLSRARGSADAVLRVTGRDIEEAEHAFRFASDLGAWQMLDGPAGDYDLGDTRRRIVQLLRDSGPLKPKAIAERLGITEDNARQTARRMADAGQIDTDGAGTYFEPLSPVTPVTAVTHAVGDGDRCDRSDSEHDRARLRVLDGIEP